MVMRNWEILHGFLAAGANGETVIRGTQVPFLLLLEHTRNGYDRSYLQKEFPDVPNDVWAALYWDGESQ